jgi:hypothetical protein
MGYSHIAPDIIAQIKDPANRDKPVRTLAAELNVSKSAVHHIRSAASHPAPKLKQGRPRKTLPNQRTAIKRRAERTGDSLVKLAAWSAQRGYPRISAATVSAVLKGGRVPLQYKPVLRGRSLSEKNRLLRLAFAKQHKSDNWKHTVFIDMKTLLMRWDEAQGYKMRWQRAGSKKRWKQASNAVAFNFYAPVAHGKKSSLVMVPMEQRGKKGKPSFNSSNFIQVMQQLFEEVQGWFPSGLHFRVILDNATQHESDESKAAMADMGVPLMTSFPPQAYDMNLIEVVWGQLQSQMLGNRFKKKESYEQALRQAWDSVDQGIIDKLVANHCNQMKKIINAEGSWVDY